MRVFRDGIPKGPEQNYATMHANFKIFQATEEVHDAYYVLALPEVTGYVCALRKEFYFCLNKRPFKILIDRVSWDTRACAREPIHHNAYL